MFKTRTRRVALALTIAAVACSAVAQQAKTYRIGLLSAGSAAFYAKELTAYRDGLHDYGYEEGRNLTIEYRYAEGDYAKLPTMAKELAADGINIFFAPTEPALLAAKGAGTIPVVTVSCDPLVRLLGSLARPGGNATGFTCISSDLIGKRFQLLKELVPGLARVAVLYNGIDTDDSELKDADLAGAALGLAITRFPINSADEFDGAFHAMALDHIQAVQIFTSALTNFNRKRLAQLAIVNRIPATFSFREFAEEGGLVAYGASLSDGWRRAAYFTDRILKGTAPADLPVEQPTRFYLVVNRTTSAALGLAIPESIRVRADDIID